MTQPGYYSQPPKKRGRGGLVVGITAAVLVALVVGVAGGYFLFKAHPNALNRVLDGNNSAHTLPGVVNPLVKKAKDAGALDPSMTYPNKLSIALPLSHQAQLRAYLAVVNDPASPFYHKYLSPDAFKVGGTYGPSSDTVAAVTQYLEQSGLTVTKDDHSDSLLNIGGTVGAVESAFQIKLHKYTLNGQTYISTDSNPKVSNPYIANIIGLDNFSTYRSHLAPMPQGSAGYSAAQLQKAYNAAGLASKGIDGSGQSIAFLELSDFNDADVQQYQQQNNLTGGTFTRVPVDGGAQLDSQGSVEVELDMEVAFAMAPKASELIYEGQNSNQGINDVYSQIVNDNKAKVVSISWGLCEQSTGSAELQSLDQIFQQGAAEGVTFFAAAGDSGAYDCGDTNLGVDSPADDPYVTGVGGTSLTAASDGTYTSETAWSCTDSNCTNNAPQGAGGGGGVSANFPVPNFQSGLNPNGAQSQGRYVPDVSANADPNTGYAIIASGQQTVVGGTSGAAPLWAGGAALMAEALGKQGKGLDNLNSLLYSAEKTNGAFHDVTQGTNLYYKAAQGYDLATGLGSPDFATLASAIASGATGTPPTQPTPTPGGNPTPTPGAGNNPTPTPPTGGGTGSGNGEELLTNNGFENGSSPWGEDSQAGYELIVSKNDPNSPAKVHSGDYAAYLCGYKNCQDSIGQAFAIPNGASKLTLSYWWEMDTQKSGGCNDKFTVDIYSTTDDGSGNLTLGQSIGQVQSVCDSNANNSYGQKTADLSQLLGSNAGQTLAVVFSATTDGGSSTSAAFVDDVSLQAQ